MTIKYNKKPYNYHYNRKYCRINLLYKVAELPLLGTGDL